jgi:hypothetical protein
MRLSAIQIAALRQSAQNPGRAPSPDVDDPRTPSPASAFEIPEEVKRALMDACWAAEPNHERSAAPASAPESGGPQAHEAAADDGWQPISTAPVLRNVEVRTADILGRYALLYPCRLVPERGWINAILATPLTVEPVEWREWLRTYPRSL